MNEIGKHESFLCECHDKEHQIIFEIDKDTNELICSVHLSSWFGIFKRIKYAIKYILGYKSRYGNWDVVIFKKEDIPRLKKLIEEIENNSYER